MSDTDTAPVPAPEPQPATQEQQAATVRPKGGLLARFLCPANPLDLEAP